jgi:hypothetical protein
MQHKFRLKNHKNKGFLANTLQKRSKKVYSIRAGRPPAQPVILPGAWAFRRNSLLFRR